MARQAFDVDLSEVIRLERRFRSISESKGERELERSLVDTGRATRTAAGRFIRRRYNVGLKFLNASAGRTKRLADPFYDFDNLSFRLAGRGGGINLIDYVVGNKAKYLVGRPPKRGVAVRVLKGKKDYVGNAFVRKIKKGPNKGKTLVLRRARGAPRTPLRQVYGPNVAMMLANESVSSETIEFAENRLVEVLDRRLTRLIERNG